MGTATPRWPAGHRAALCVSIDVDGAYGEANYRSPDDIYWLSQALYDPTGTARLLDLLADAGTPATFCWVARAAEDEPDLVRRAVAEGHELALHSWDHRHYAPMGKDGQRQDMERSLATLSRIGGVTPVGHKTPGWRYDADTLAVAQELGLVWVMDEPRGDLPTLLRPDPARGPLVNLPPSRWFDDYTYQVDHMLTPQATFETWREDLEVLRAEGRAMFLTLHPFVSGRPGPSRAIARLLDHAVDMGDVWIARADQIARWWLERDV
ncbi:MAG: polysaccharide deacetylase family protein [Thermomicrobiales bacterium]|nr:polysaccharide deacetylase family protein [Thermomicrobiales bacterium]